MYFQKYPSQQSMPTLSIVIPARNEAQGLNALLPILIQRYPEAEVVIVNDGSTDETAAICAQYKVKLITHPYAMGNGAAIKSGARNATGDVIIFMDADGQHDPNDIQQLLNKLAEGYDMVVGARESDMHANVGRSYANAIYNRLASSIVGRKIDDLTSGFRAARAIKFKEFLYLLPNGFSYPTTITMSFFRAGYPVGYLPIRVKSRVGQSHIHPLRDGIRFLLIIFKIGTLYSPLKIFLPVSASFFVTALGYYAYTYITASRLTNMTVLLFTTSIIIFLIGLVSEQITNLLYSHRDRG